VDHWHIVLGKLRRAIKGCGQNSDSYQKKLKQEILREIAVLDEESECRDLTQDEWERRYELEMALQQILQDEELHWQRRGGEK